MLLSPASRPPSVTWLNKLRADQELLHNSCGPTNHPQRLSYDPAVEEGLDSWLPKPHSSTSPPACPLPHCVITPQDPHLSIPHPTSHPPNSPTPSLQRVCFSGCWLHEHGFSPWANAFLQTLLLFVVFGMSHLSPVALGMFPAFWFFNQQRKWTQSRPPHCANITPCLSCSKLQNSDQNICHCLCVSGVLQFDHFA